MSRHTSRRPAAIEPLESRRLLAAGVMGPLTVGDAASLPARQVEYLNRGVVAFARANTTIYVSWRLVATDPADVGFNVYRSVNGGAPTKLNASPITATTDYADSSSINRANAYSYTVKAVVNGVEQATGESYGLPANVPVRQYRQIPLTPPPGGSNPSDSYTYNANDASAGDVDGDGQYEIFLKWDPSDSHDSSQDGFTGDTYYDCYRLDGTRLWRIDLGRNVRAGAHCTQFLVYDLDGDGRAEVVLKTAPGTLDGQGNPVLLGSDKVTDDYRDATTGRVNSGPEYITVFSGLTGAALTTVPYKPDRVATTSWGDDYGNRQDRILMAVAYLDGQHPSIVMGRGLFPGQSSGHAVRNEITAWDYRNGALSMRWWFRASKGNASRGIPDQNVAYIGQGNYEMHPADVDGDGRDEIVYGSMTVNDDGQPLYSTGLGHGDALFVGDLIPSNPGLEVYMPMESPSSNGHITANVHDGATGAVLWSTLTRPGDVDPDVGRGNAMDIDPRYPGVETWDTYNTDVYNPQTNTDIQAKPSNMFVNFGIWWDADPMRELLDGTTISDYRITNGVGGRSNYVFAPSGLAANNGTKNTPCLVADLFGDWREEVVWRASDNSYLQIWSTTISASNRIVTLMQDVQYRESVAWQNVGYNQPTSAGFYLGSASDGSGGFAPIPAPNVYVTAGSVTGHAFVDNNADNVLSGPEPTLPGITVYLDANGNAQLDPGEQTAATDATGTYTFANAVPGDYMVRESALPPGYVAWQPVPVTVLAGGALSGIDLSNLPTTYSGTAGADAYLLRRNAAGELEIFAAGLLRQTLPSGVVPALTFSLAAGDDRLTLDFANGSPVPAGGVTTDAETILVPHTPALGEDPADVVRHLLYGAQIRTSVTGRCLGYIDDGTAVVVKPALTGDANLDGAVNADDIALLDAGVALARHTWTFGDFNYDGTVDAADGALLYASLSGPSGEPALSAADAATTLSDVTPVEKHKKKHRKTKLTRPKVKVAPPRMTNIQPLLRLFLHFLRH